jgi:2-polyprenyl-3-methyl-5-hydroxy-6-metoxy-1,4-benzoquinol methylase
MTIQRAGDENQMQMRTRVVGNCDLCGGSNFSQVAAPDASGSAVMMCETCTLFFASPTLELAGFENFYDQEFVGDTGSTAAQAAGKKDNSKKEMKRATEWALPIILQHMPDLSGKHILDLRSRDGALAHVLKEHGAVVTATDPMRPNVERSSKRGLKAVYMPVAAHANLADFNDKSFDIVTALTIHLLSHLPQPSAFLKSAYRTLVPGGLLILDEKDVLKPHRVQANTVFDDVGGHLFQFTYETFQLMVEQAGFEVVEYSYDPPRFSKFRHMVMVARRPFEDSAAQVVVPLKKDFPNSVKVRQALTEAQRLLWLKAPFNRALKYAKRLF